MRLVDQLVTLARRRVLWPGRPDRIVAQLDALYRWGFGLAGEARQAAARSPDSVAVIDEERGPVSYAELLAGSERATCVLLETVAPGGRIGVLCRNHLGLCEVLVGAASAGVDVILVNTGLSARQVADVAREQELELLVHDIEFAGLVSGVACDRLDEAELLRRMEASGRGPLAPLGPPAHQGRTIVLTSGTTGTPKGARRPHPTGFSALASILDRIPFGVGERVLLSAPMFHTWGFAGFQLCLALRATMVLQRRFDPAEARAALRRHQCEAMIAVPVMLQRMLDLPDGDGSEIGGSAGVAGPAGGDRLRIVALSGSALPTGLATRFMADYGPVVYNLYGSTEVSWVSIADPEDLAADPDCAGRPPRGTRVAIVGESGEEVEPGGVGGIFVGNDMVFDGYTNGVTRATWHGLVSTGDLGRWAGGRLRVEGREDDMIVSGGENVYPGELERVVASFPEVLDCSVFGVPDPAFGQRLVVAVVPADGAAPDAQQLVERLRPLVARHVMPREIYFVADLPRNATGKVMVRDLRADYLDSRP